MEQNTANCANAEGVFRRLRLQPPVASPIIDAHGFNSRNIESYSAFLRINHGLLGDLIRSHRCKDLFDRRLNKRLFVPQTDFPNKSR
jgi:hypothetical protein